MRVVITREGVYSSFEAGKAGAQALDAGDVVEFPDWYAESLIDADYAQLYREQDAPEIVDATEAAYELAAELGLDIHQIEGSGKGGRVTVQDVRDASE